MARSGALTFIIDLMIPKFAKQLARTATPGFIKSFLMRLGRFYSSSHDPSVAEFPSHEGALHTLKKLGWKPDICIDVGAYEGQWAQMFRSIFPDAHVLMIEAQEAKEPFLQKIASTSNGMLDYRLALLGASDEGEVEFFEMETGSSVYEEASCYPRTKVKKKLTTLDSLIERHPPVRETQMLKIDTQGYELEILRGAAKTIQALDVILMETSLIPINKSAPLFSDVIDFLTQKRFNLFDFCSQIRRKDGVLWQTDLMFIREGSAIKPDQSLTQENWG